MFLTNWLDRLTARGFLTQPKGLRALLLITMGALAGLGQAPFDLPWLSVLAFAFVFALQGQGGMLRAAVARGWFFGLGYFGLTLHWIVQPFLVEPEVYGWMAPFALVFLAAGLAVFWAAAFAVAHRIGGDGDRAQIALALVWTAVEILRSYVFTGFPWVLPGHIWINGPEVWFASYVGAHGLTLMTFGLAIAAIKVATTDKPLIWLAPIVAFLASGLLGRSHTDIPPNAPLIRIVQPNAPQDQKFDPDFIPIFERRLMLATSADPAPALVVWPETAVPYLLEWSDDILQSASDLARGAPVVLGINRRDGDRFYNSLVVAGLGGQVIATYDKEHLVPFGEYMPLGEVFARFGVHGLAASEGGGFTSGSDQPLIDLPGLGLFRPLICYEASFAQEIVTGDQRPDALLLVTNDAWFGQDAGPYQHLAHARLRAVEQGLPVIRSANTGVSAMIDGYGKIIDQLPLGVAGHFDAQLPPPLPATVYSKTGDWPVILFLFAILSAIALTGRNRKPIDLGDRAH